MGVRFLTDPDCSRTRRQRNSSRWVRRLAVTCSHPQTFSRALAPKSPRLRSGMRVREARTSGLEQEVIDEVRGHKLPD